MSIQLTSTFKKHLLKTSQGLSLIELLATLAIITILLSVGLPSFSRMIDKNRLETASNDLMTAIQTTRNLAVTKHQRAVLKARQEWHKGWDVFIDKNDNGNLDSDEIVLLTQNELNGIKITSTSQKMKAISFINTGESRQVSGSAGGSFLAGTLQVCASNNNGYKLVLARGGRTRLAKSNCS